MNLQRLRFFVILDSLKKMQFSTFFSQLAGGPGEMNGNFLSPFILWIGTRSLIKFFYGHLSCYSYIQEAQYPVNSCFLFE